MDIQVNDLTILLVLTFPMFIFTIYPAVKLGDFLEEKYAISETRKRGTVAAATFLGAFVLALFLKYF